MLKQHFFAATTYEEVASVVKFIAFSWDYEEDSDGWFETDLLAVKETEKLTAVPPPCIK